MSFLYEAATSFDALSLNYGVVFVEDACRGITIAGIEEQKRKLEEHGAVIVYSEKVRDPRLLKFNTVRSLQIARFGRSSKAHNL